MSLKDDMIFVYIDSYLTVVSVAYLQWPMFLFRYRCPN